MIQYMCSCVTLSWTCIFEGGRCILHKWNSGKTDVWRVETVLSDTRIWRFPARNETDWECGSIAWNCRGKSSILSYEFCFQCKIVPTSKYICGTVNVWIHSKCWNFHPYSGLQYYCMILDVSYELVTDKNWVSLCQIS